MWKFGCGHATCGPATVNSLATHSKQRDKFTKLTAKIDWLRANRMRATKLMSHHMRVRWEGLEIFFWGASLVPRPLFTLIPNTKTKGVEEAYPTSHGSLLHHLSCRSYTSVKLTMWASGPVYFIRRKIELMQKRCNHDALIADHRP